MMILTRPPAVFTLQSRRYYVFPRIHPFRHSSPQFSLRKASDHVEDLREHAPCSLFISSGPEHLERSLIQKINEFLITDDVFCKDFLENVLISFPKMDDKVTATTFESLQEFGTKTVFTVQFTNAPHLPPGPYFLEKEGIRQAWRCYSDPLAAFVRPIVPIASGGTYEDPCIPLYPVPSRLYSEPKSKEKPLSGLRFAIKDVIDIEGVPTTNCCRAYTEVYEFAKSTASIVQQLIARGAIPIGKTRTVQFASGSHPMDWVDWQCSFNPRGDGYQSPSMSSAGSAAAVAGYDWIDFAVGTDTFGSVIMPAAACGVYGFRPTKGLQDLSGIIPVSEHLDTVGFFTRSIAEALSLAQGWSEDDAVRENSKHDTEIFYPVDMFPFENAQYQATVEKFVALLEEFLGAKAHRISLAERWSKSSYGDGRSLEEYLDCTIPHIQLKDCFDNSAEFRQTYHNKFGKTPYVDPVIRYKWELSHSVSNEQYDKAVKEQNTFSDWIAKEVIPPGSDSLLLLPAGIDSPTYRDQYFGTVEESGRKMQGFGFSPLVLPALAGLPTATLPVGEFDYDSRVSGTKERLPVCVTVSGHRGGDHKLWKLLDKFIETSERVPSSVATGKWLYPNGGLKGKS